MQWDSEARYFAVKRESLICIIHNYGQDPIRFLQYKTKLLNSWFSFLCRSHLQHLPKLLQRPRLLQKLRLLQSSRLVSVYLCLLLCTFTFYLDHFKISSYIHALGRPRWQLRPRLLQSCRCVFESPVQIENLITEQHIDKKLQMFESNQTFYCVEYSCSWFDPTPFNLVNDQHKTTQKVTVVLHVLGISESQKQLIRSKFCITGCCWCCCCCCCCCGKTPSCFWY